MPQANIDVREDFKHEEGKFENYTALGTTTQQTQLQKQKHVDLRSFVKGDVTVRVNMLSLSLLSVVALDQKTMSNLNGSVSVRADERWTNQDTSVTTGAQADRNNWNGLQMTCVTTENPNTTTSIMVTT